MNDYAYLFMYQRTKIIVLENWYKMNRHCNNRHHFNYHHRFIFISSPIFISRRNMGKTSSSRMALWAILIAASPLLASSADVNYGLKMFVKAGKGACWMDKLHKLPTVNIKDPKKLWGTCENNMKFADDEWEQQYKTQADPQPQPITDPDIIKALEANAMINLKSNIKTKLRLLDPPYLAGCGKFVDNENQAPSKDFSSLLKDSSDAYPFKGLAHCVLEVTEKVNGKSEMNALKSRWTSPKPFHEAILERENENRARHDSPPLTLDSTLNAQAQKWAEKLAAANYCKSTHEKIFNKDSANIKYQGKSTGENINKGTYKNGDDGDTGVDMANSWYREVEDYPWPYWQGQKTKGKIGHFTATVWKSTKLAGYGIARSPGCDSVFVVARYFPAGNGQHKDGDKFREYPKNVLPKNY